jgi:hypothetical protein
LFLRIMRHEKMTAATTGQPDWKGLGYLVSIASVFFLGAIAWPKESDPWWHLPALLLGMATSIIGMGFRYKAHLDSKREIHRAEALADGARRSR